MTSGLGVWSVGNPAVVEIANGVRIDRFRCNGTGAGREPFRFIYASDYSRGLLQILSGFWYGNFDIKKQKTNKKHHL